jgi:hypothetical protein
MGEHSHLTAVPAYHATGADGGTVPFIISLLLYDAEQKPRITPAVEKSIDRTIEITGREGLATAIIADDASFSSTARVYLERAMQIAGAIVLFRCQSPETAERLMQYLASTYTLTLVRKGQKPGQVDASHQNGDAGDP